MSDLIRRKKIRDYIKGEINPYGKPFEGTAYELGLKIMRYIDSMDSDYDIDKVVEELEELRKKDVCDYLYCDVCAYTDKCSGVTDQSNNLKWDKAIEIVKHEDVDDDVCEWKYNDSEYYWESSCEHLHIFMADGPKENEYGYCPYCGKKINVVE